MSRRKTESEVRIQTPEVLESSGPRQTGSNEGQCKGGHTHIFTETLSHHIFMGRHIGWDYKYSGM